MMNRMLAAIALSLLCTATVAADTTMDALLYVVGEAAPGDEIGVYPVLQVTGNEPARDVVVTIDLPPGSLFSGQTVPADWACIADRSTMTCRIASVAPPDFISAIEFRAIVGGEILGETSISLTVTAANAPRVAVVERFFIWRLLTVTNTNDSGPGSLRDVLERANQLCAPPERCKIAFDVPTPATFEPLTPLPPVTACGQLWIDAGATSTEAPGQYELSGAKVSSGSGLEVRADCDAGKRLLEIHGLTVNRFPEDGLRIHPGGTGYSVWLSGVRIGTDTTGNHPRPNAWRGISVTSPVAALRLSGSSVSTNGRSGVYVWDSRLVEINGSSIIGNGASGIFVNRGAVTGYGGNTIAHNAHWGIAVVPGASMSLVHNNSIHSNGGPAIDWGLDGQSPQEPAGGVAPPVVHSATFNPADGTTTIRGTITVQTVRGARYEVSIYSNAAARPDAERWEGRSEMYSIYVPSPGVYPWEAVIRRDLRGRTLTAAAGVGIGDDFPTFTGSELSLPFTVE
ncbi:MAG: hypothetical protein QOJ98_598 [Acidobacteriota bacterium]|nr:hypothetical protein [Acidobacteriota bacterium]